MSDTSSVQRLAYIEIEVSDLEAWRTFAQDVLSVEVVEGTSSETLLLRMDDRTFRIALKQGPRDDIVAIGLEVDSKQALERVCAALRAAGCDPVDAKTELAAARGVAELVTVLDPAGLTVELSYGSMERPQHPFRSPRPHGGFVTGKQGMGHVMLSVHDVAEVQHFYENVLSFRVSDVVATSFNGNEARFVFMRCNDRHHTLAIGKLPLNKRLVHFMMQCRDLDDVGRALDCVPRSGLRQSRSLGRHVNDRMLSFYMETPSKVQVEYGFGGLEVDDGNWSVTTYDVTSIWGHRHL